MQKHSVIYLLNVFAAARRSFSFGCLLNQHIISNAVYIGYHALLVLIAKARSLTFLDLVSSSTSRCPNFVTMADLTWEGCSRTIPPYSLATLPIFKYGMIFITLCLWNCTSHILNDCFHPLRTLKYPVFCN